jgi:hypothetical protein
MFNLKVMNDVRKEFLVDRDNTGREIVFLPETKKKYYVEFIGGRANWGDLNPATGKIEGNYGQKYKGSIKAEESVITKENGFDNIVEGKGSPYETIIEMHEKWKKENEIN